MYQPNESFREPQIHAQGQVGASTFLRSNEPDNMGRFPGMSLGQELPVVLLLPVVAVVLAAARGAMKRHANARQEELADGCSIAPFRLCCKSEPSRRQ